MPFVKPRLECYTILCMCVNTNVISPFVNWLAQSSKPIVTVLKEKEEFSIAYNTNGRRIMIRFWVIQPTLATHPLPNLYHNIHATIFVHQSSNMTDWLIWKDLVKEHNPNAQQYLVTDCNITKCIKSFDQSDSSHADYTTLNINSVKDGQTFLKKIINITQNHSSMEYRHTVDITRDQRDVINTTSCYERNGIA
ncbi:uncharacterized protein LOC100185101 [Ciona intestinalis]